MHGRCNGAHLLKARGDEARETHNVDILLLYGLYNRLRRNHYAKVDNVESVAREDYSDDVFSNVVNIAFYSRNQNLAAAGTVGVLSFLYVRLKYSDGFLHVACRFYDLRKKHLSCAEEFAYAVHSVHQRTGDYLERRHSLVEKSLNINIGYFVLWRSFFNNFLFLLRRND